MTTELLTVRLNSVNEILALQEEKMVKKVSVNLIQACDNNTWNAAALLLAGQAPAFQCVFQCVCCVPGLRFKTFKL